MGGSANTKKEVKRNGKLYKYELDPPRRYYRCYGYQQMRLQCRAKPMIRAERLESLVWNQVKNALENPDLIVAGIEALNAQEDGGGLVEEIALAERDLQKVQMEEDRAIRLYVSGKITEDQLDRQRRFITERLETLRARLDEYRSQQTALAEKRILMLIPLDLLVLALIARHRPQDFTFRCRAYDFAVVGVTRRTRTRQQFLWGGWTCRRCGSEHDRHGNLRT